MGSDRIKIIYILGQFRSGTTLLDRLLGQIDGFFSTGELQRVWDWGFSENVLCACGTKFHDCEFWSAVIREYCGGIENANTARMLELSALTEKHARIPQLLVGGVAPGFRRALNEYLEHIGGLYRAIHKVSGGAVIVDSSKTLPYALCLRRLPDVDLHILHVVRDPRAVAYSWQRRRIRPEIQTTRIYMHQFSTRATALRWLFYNAAAHAVRPVFAHYTRVRYEDLSARPSQIMKRLIRQLGEAGRSLDFVQESSATLKPGHLVAGNPMRFKTGMIEIKRDTEWQTGLPAGARRFVTLTTLPLLIRYGYLIPPRGGG